MAKNLLGKKCPSFKAEATNNQTLSNASFAGKNLVIYFYPKDSTPGCTTEGQEFRDSYKIFKKMNTEILGVSRESIKSHENFKSKQSFPFELLSDPDEKVCKAFDVMKLNLCTEENTWELIEAHSLLIHLEKLEKNGGVLRSKDMFRKYWRL